MLKRLKTLLMWGDRSPRARRHQLFCLACALIILGCVAYDLVRTAVNNGGFSEGGVSVSVDEDEGRASLSIEGENGLDVDFGVEGPSFG